MTENKCSSLEKSDITIAPKQILFLDHEILFLMADGVSEKLEEDRVLLVCIEQENTEEGSSIRLPVEKVTIQTVGHLFLGTVYGTRCEIRTDKMHSTEGEVLIDILQHYPWLWVGDHECLNSHSKKKWEELQYMVEEMRACSILFG